MSRRIFHKRRQEPVPFKDVFDQHCHHSQLHDASHKPHNLVRGHLIIGEKSYHQALGLIPSLVSIFSNRNINIVKINEQRYINRHT